MNWFETPRQLGPYRLAEELGRGGMGAVFRATSEETREVVAIKILPPELGTRAGFRDRFQREVDTLSSLSHPNIVHFLEAGETGGHSWYAMELVAGKTLSELLIERKRLPWLEVADLGVQVCHALKHAHDRGVIHRDLKLSNLLLTPEGQLKLSDFGIARVFDGAGLTETRGVVGTAEFMSPEQAEGKPISRRSDLYSLGIVLYGLIVGKLPFRGNTAIEVMHKQCYAQFDKPSMFVAELPADYEQLILDLLEKEPRKRPADAYVVGKRLDSLRRRAESKSSVSAFSLEGEEIDDESASRPTMSAKGGGSSSTLVRVEDAADEAEEPISGMRSRLRDSLDRHLESIKTGLLAASLFAVLGAIVWSLWPPSDETLLAKGEALFAANTREDDRIARDLAFQPLLDRHPSGPIGEHARKRLEEIQARSVLRSAKRGFMAPARLKANQEEMSDAERFYRRAESDRVLGRLAQAREGFEAIAAAFADEPADRYWVEAARARVVEIDSRDKKSNSEAAARLLERARKLSESGEAEKATEVLKAIIVLYRDSPAARADVEEAKRRLESSPALDRP